MCLVNELCLIDLNSYCTVSLCRPCAVGAASKWKSVVLLFWVGLYSVHSTATRKYTVKCMKNEGHHSGGISSIAGHKWTGIGSK